MLGGISGWCDVVGAFTPSFKTKGFSFCSSFHPSSLSPSFPPTLGGAAGRGFLAKPSIPAATVGYEGMFPNLLLGPSSLWLTVFIRVNFFTRRMLNSGPEVTP